MRNIKFRGKTNGERWVYGSLVDCVWVKTDKNSKVRTHIIDENGLRCFVYSNTVSQFTKKRLREATESFSSVEELRLI